LPADVGEQVELLGAVTGIEVRIVADEDLGVVGIDLLDVLQPPGAPLGREPVVPARLDGHGERDRVAQLPRLVDDGLAVVFVDEHAGPAVRELRLRLPEPGEDQAFRGLHGRTLSRVGVVVPDAEQRPGERAPVVHGEDEQRIVVPRFPGHAVQLLPVRTRRAGSAP
jgi:hypothetical protein